jgi:hypothetical protein
MFPRKGTIEVETLRRYGRTPAGTRAVGWFKVSENSDRYMTHKWEVRIRIGADPRVVRCQCYFPWHHKRIDEPHTYGVFHRGKHLTFSATDLFDWVVQDVVRFVESLNTGAKNQRFRVIRATWQDEEQAPDEAKTGTARGQRGRRNAEG